MISASRLSDKCPYTCRMNDNAAYWCLMFEAYRLVFFSFNLVKWYIDGIEIQKTASQFVLYLQSTFVLVIHLKLNWWSSADEIKHIYKWYFVRFSNQWKMKFNIHIVFEINLEKGPAKHKAIFSTLSTNGPVPVQCRPCCVWLWWRFLIISVIFADTPHTPPLHLYNLNIHNKEEKKSHQTKPSP